MKAIARAKKLLLENVTKAKLFGMGDNLQVIVAALDEVDLMASAQAEAMLLMALELQNALGIKTKIHHAHLQLIGSASDFAETLARRLMHGDRCMCDQCLLPIPPFLMKQESTTGGTVVKPKG